MNFKRYFHVIIVPLLCGIIFLSSCGEHSEPDVTSDTADNIATQSDTAVAETTSETETVVTTEVTSADLENAQLIPVININTNGSQAITSKEIYTDGVFEILYPDSIYLPDISGAEMQIRGRGHSTWRWEKKPYKIKFIEKVSLFGLRKAKEWVLLANYSDHSLIRNNVVFDAAKTLDKIPFVPTAHSVDLYLNGEYCGVYSLCEQIEVKSGRIEPEGVFTEEDPGFLLEAGAVDESNYDKVNRLYLSALIDIVVEYPDTEDLTDEQYAFIENYGESANSAVCALENWPDYLDIDSFVDYFIINELFYNLDGSAYRSFFLLKDPGGKFKVATLWDYDLSAGNYAVENSSFYQVWACSIESDFHRSDNWYTYLLKDKRFTDALKLRWNEKKEEIYDAAMTSIEANYRLLKNSQVLNFERWDVMGISVGYCSQSTAEISSYSGHIDYLKEFITRRKKWMDTKINSY